MAIVAPGAVEATPDAEGGRNRSGAPSLLVARVVSLIVPVVPLAVVVAVETARGWRPTSDDAAIAWRSFDVFGAHAPLLGAYNDASVSSARPIFDLGPMQYYLLSVPDRIDPVHGILWGSALVLGLLTVLAVEAAWRSFGVFGALLVSAGYTIFAATQVVAVLNLPWNPNFGLYAFAASLLFAMATATGHTRWWPAGAAAGCLAAECHLVFAIPAAAALLVAAGAGLIARARADDGVGRGIAHLVLGVAVATAELVPPIVQQLADRSGNLSALGRNLARQGPTRGLASGFAAIERSAGIWPLWTHPVPAIGSVARDERFLGAVMDGSSNVGIALVAAAGLVGILALVRRRTGLAAASLIACAAGTGLAWTFGAIAQRQTAVLTYTDVALWPVGMAIDLSLVWGVVEAGRTLARRPLAGGHRPASDRRGGVARRPGPWLLSGIGLVGLAASLAWALTSIVPSTHHSDAVIGGWPVSRAVGPLAAAIERAAPHGSVVVEPSPPLFADGLPTWSLAEGVAYALHAAGRSVSVLLPMTPELGQDAVPPRHPAIVFDVVPNGPDRWRVHRILRAHPLQLFDLWVPR